MSESGSERPAARPVVKHAGTTGPQKTDPARAMSSEVLLGPDDGAPNFALRRFRMEAGGGMPLHTNAVEHEQFVLRGRAEVRLGEARHVVEPGTVLFIPAGLPHSYTVLDPPFEFLCVVPNGPDRIEIVED